MKSTTYNLLGLLLGMSIFVSSCTTEEDAKEEKPLNVLFILADDLGRMDLACYGSLFHETPNLDRLAKEGIMFTDAYAACPVCSPTRASILTGKYPARLGVTDWIPGRQSYIPVEPNNQLIAKAFEHQAGLEENMISEAFQAAGYTTFFGGKWHVGEDSIYWPENQGFDINKGGHNRGSPPGGYFSPYKNPRLTDGPEGEYLTDRLANEAVQFLDTIGENPFLLYMSFYTVHNPMQGKDSLVAYFQEKADQLSISEEERFNTQADWIKKAPQKGNFRERLVQDYPVYASMVYSLDQNIGKMLDALDKNGLAENTLIVFTSDNGGLSTSEGSPTSNLPFRAGKGWLYEGGIREPFLMRWPGTIAPGSVSDALISSPDLYPTILEAAGLPLNPNQHVDGQSFLTHLKEQKGEGEEHTKAKALYWHYPHYSNQGGRPGGAVRKGNYKLIEWYETGKLELYDLMNDPGELVNLAESSTEKREELHQELISWRETQGATMMEPNPEFNPNYVRNTQE